MRTPSRFAWLVGSLALLGALSGCTAFAGRSDYLDYRAVRLAADPEQRVLAMQRYVAGHPDGRWYDSIQREREAGDRALFEQGKSTRAGLELYLKAFPDGAFADQAASRLSAVAGIEQRKRSEAARAAELVQARKLREAELSRTWVTRFFGYWVRTLAGLTGWGAPVEQVARSNADFSRAFGRPPRPRCSSDECVKYYESNFAVPVPGGTRLERTMRLVLRLRMDQGRVVRAELLLPDHGFSRWKELEERKPVVDADPEARQQAVDWAVGHALELLDRVRGATDGSKPARDEISGYVVSAIPVPAIGPTGELVDTTAEDPSAPTNRIQGGAASAASAPEAEPTVTDMLKPQAPEQAADLEMAPLRVGADGRPLPDVPAAGAPATTPTQAPTPASGEVMEMAPLAVPPAAGASATASPAAGPAAAPAPVPAATTALAVSPAVARAFLLRPDLRVVVFAAASDERSPAYDGIAIERVAPATARPKARPAAPAR